MEGGGGDGRGGEEERRSGGGDGRGVVGSGGEWRGVGWGGGDHLLVLKFIINVDTSKSISFPYLGRYGHAAH